MNNIIEATILNGKFKSEDVVLPRIPKIPQLCLFNSNIAVSGLAHLCNDHQQSTRTMLQV